MKTKLLFFLLTIFSFTSCVEYVDNGVIDFTPEPPQENVYTAEVANPGEAKYVGDTFILKATLNNVDVTASTKFRINGIQNVGNTYIPHRVGANSVIATMDDYEFTFRFTVLDRDGDPDPVENRIEYEGKSYPITHTEWAVYVNKDTNLPIIYDNVGVPGEFTLWGLRSMDHSSFPMAQNGMMISVYVPVNQNGIPQDLHEVDLQTLHFQNSASVKIEGNLKPFTTLDNGYPILDFISINDQNANYTIEVKNGNESAKLYWSGSFVISTLSQ